VGKRRPFEPHGLLENTRHNFIQEWVYDLDEQRLRSDEEREPLEVKRVADTTPE
jgi:hypothetical protein